MECRGSTGRFKLAYSSQAKAKRAATRPPHAGHGVRLYPYLCRCGQWHLSKRPPAPKRTAAFGSTPALNPR